MIGAAVLPYVCRDEDSRAPLTADEPGMVGKESVHCNGVDAVWETVSHWPRWKHKDRALAVASLIHNHSVSTPNGISN
ncbi:hypothetical protein DPMN_173374 [Dreissena polymorpha]|uniref:Uncharacterized protein n=1 Tax=Dreissena polymorpha TaxID=45954 RepID=A0A9D4IGW0_DREPO|nr:hypothetical protein DPMN_173374 [Dreissena polymorpha]